MNPSILFKAFSLLAALILNATVLHAQAAYPVVAEAVDDVVHINWKTNLDIDFYQKLTAEEKEGLVKMYTTNTRAAHYHAMSFLHNCRTYLDQILTQHNNGKNDPQYDYVRGVLEKTVLLKESDYTLYLPDLIKACDDILAGVTHNYDFCYDANDTSCRGSGFTLAHVYAASEMEKNPELSNSVVICVPNGLEGFYTTPTNNAHWDCLIGKIIHELHHLRSGSRHSVDCRGSVAGTSSAPLGSGKFLKDAYRIEAMVMGMNMKPAEFEAWCEECNHDSKDLICGGRIILKNGDTPETPGAKPAAPAEEQTQEQPKEEAPPAEDGGQ
jgi:hypothetical protein